MKSIHLFLFYLLLWTATCTIGLANASNQITRIWNGNVIIEARDSFLNDIIKELYDKYSIEVSGLESRESDKITFSFEADTLEALLRSLLRHLGVKSFAIEYIDAALKRIVVVPDAMSDINAFEKAKTNPLNHEDSLSLVEIQGIVELSQAEKLDLTAGDLIVEYDGVRITNARQLVEEVEKKAENNQVEMIVIQEKIPIRMILAGGMIGVKIVTKEISKEEIPFKF